MVKEIAKVLGHTAKGMYEQFPFHDDEKKIQIKNEKIKQLKQQENEVYAEMGRLTYRRNGAKNFPLQKTKLEKLYHVRRTLECEVDGLSTKQKPNETICECCGSGNTQDMLYCCHCGKTLAEPVCPSCGKRNPTQSCYCGYCGNSLAAP